jgi:predicted GTPase
MNKQQGEQAISQSLAALPTSIADEILQHLRHLTDYVPVIGIMGKTGVGKSSLYNALFQEEISPVSDVSTCTREALYFQLQRGEREMTRVDLPMVEALMHCLPRHATSPLTTQLRPVYRTDSVVEKTRTDFGESVSKLIDWMIDSVPLPAPVKTLVKSVKTASNRWLNRFGAGCSANALPVFSLPPLRFGLSGRAVLLLP